MLEDCLIDSRSSARSKKPATLIASILVHGTLIAALVLIPLFQIPSLPLVAAMSPLPPPVAPRSVELVPAPRAISPARSASFRQETTLVVPPVPPTTIIKDADEPIGDIVGLVPSSGTPNGPVIPGFSDRLSIGVGSRVAPPSPPPAPPVPPPAPPAVEPKPSGPIRVASIDPSKLIRSVTPIYPRLAVITRVQGSVVLEAVITREGAVDSQRLRVVSGHPMLVPAAVEAVEQWRYKPTILNGEAVEVLATITVNFTLN